MKKIVFVTHEFGLFSGHGGVASYLHILVTEILERHKDYKVYILAIKYDEQCELLKNKSLTIKLITGVNAHLQGLQVLEHLIKIKPDFVECTDYISLGLEALTYRAETEKNELSDTIFITLHHTASRECYEWNDKVPVRFAPPYIQECFVRERTQMKLSDLNIAPSNFMNMYVSKNYDLDNVITILHPLMLNQYRKKDIIEKLSEKYDFSPYKNKFIVNCISRVEGRKNQMLLVKQFERFLKITNADALLFIVGNSSINTVTGKDFRFEINEAISPEYRNKIMFFDFMKEKQKEKIFALSDLSVLASPYECLSLAMVESVSYEVPVICSTYCGFSDYMGISTESMTFNPFKNDDLSDKIVAFYNLTASERKKVTDMQIEKLNKLASFKTTVDNRLEIYEKAKTEKKLNANIFKVLIVDETNYLDKVTSEIIDYGYNCIIVDFFFNKTNNNFLKEIFYRVGQQFHDGDIIGYGYDSVRQCYINVLLDYIPFFIKGVKIDASLFGKNIIDVIKNYVQSSTPVFSLVGKTAPVDVVKEKPSNIIVNKREAFMKELISSAFYNENNLNLEEKVND